MNLSRVKHIVISMDPEKKDSKIINVNNSPLSAIWANGNIKVIALTKMKVEAMLGESTGIENKKMEQKR